MKYDLSIVIPVFNNFSFTQKCLEDLVKLPLNHEIIIVDNASTDGTKRLEAPDGRTIITRNKENLGFGKACNIGFSLSSGQNVMFLNNDVRVKSDHETWTQPIIEAAKGRCLVGPTIGCIDDDFNFICEANKMPTRGHVYMSGWNITANYEIWKELIINEDIGPFSTEFFAYFEDTDLGFRARKAGIEFNIVDVPVHHFGRMTGKKLNLSAMYGKSKLTFTKKWMNNV